MRHERGEAPPTTGGGGSGAQEEEGRTRNSFSFYISRCISHTADEEERDREKPNARAVQNGKKALSRSVVCQFLSLISERKRSRNILDEFRNLVSPHFYSFLTPFNSPQFQKGMGRGGILARGTDSLPREKRSSSSRHLFRTFQTLFFSSSPDLFPLQKQIEEGKGKNCSLGLVFFHFFPCLSL